MIPSRLLRVCVLLLPLVIVGNQQAQPPARPAPEENNPKEKGVAALLEREAHCTNGSVIKLRVLDEKITLNTPYGKLVIPLEKISGIDLATRLSDADAEKIRTAVADLANEEQPKRDAGSAELTRMKLKAYPALLEAFKSTDVEVKKRAEIILQKLYATYSPDQFVLRPADVVYTNDSTISGKLETTAFKVHTDQFGEVALRLSEVSNIYLPMPKAEAISPPPPPSPDPLPNLPPPAPIPPMAVPLPPLGPNPPPGPLNTVPLR
jgi:hypothetical protein